MNVSKNQLFDCPGSECRENALLDLAGFEVMPVGGVEPVTLQEAKDFCKITATAYDTQITGFIAASRMVIERYLNICLVPRTFTAWINNPQGMFDLPYGPVKSITSVTDGEGDAIAVGDIKLVGVLFKKLESPAQDNITVEYESGYTGPLAENYRMAIKEQVLYCFEHLGDEDNPGLTQISPMAKTQIVHNRRVLNEFFL